MLTELLDFIDAAPPGVCAGWVLWLLVVLMVADCWVRARGKR